MTDDDNAAAATAVHVSAPGKVLLTGGYLLLEERFSGLVLATSARFHTTIARRAIPSSRDADVLTAPNAVLRVRVESAQFHQTVIAEAVHVDGDRLAIRVSDVSDRNAYVEEALLCALNGVVGLDAEAFSRVTDRMRVSGEELLVRLEADNAFYSQVQRLQQAGKPLSRRSLEELPAFLPPTMEADTATGASSIAKTGLGSSAALVTSLVGAVVHFFLGGSADGGDDDGETQRDVVHNLAQLSHCFVQRKIGSGFDVSAACYGTQRYARFPPVMLDEFTSVDSLQPEAIARCVSDPSRWRRSERVQPFRFPPNFHLLMGDVCTGSATVSMVKQVLNWRKSNASESARVVDALAGANAAVERAFRAVGELSAADPHAFERACAQLASSPADKWAEVDSIVGGALAELRQQYQRVRLSFREMGELAGVPIEPSEQSELIDTTLTIPGVLIAGVPGAGGYDALFVITLDSATLDRVEALWLAWSDRRPDTVICPLLCDVAPASARALAVETL